MKPLTQVRSDVRTDDKAFSPRWRVSELTLQMSAARKKQKETAGDPTAQTGGKETEKPADKAKDNSQTSAPGRSGKSALGGKEVPAFQWKLIGRSEDYILTLFKSVEREDVENQLDRLQRESYYTDLQIVDVNMPIVQSASAKAKLNPKPKAKPKPKPAAKASAKPARAAKGKRATKATKRAVPKRATAKPAKKKAKAAPRKTRKKKM